MKSVGVRDEHKQAIKDAQTKTKNRAKTGRDDAYAARQLLGEIDERPKGKPKDMDGLLRDGKWHCPACTHTCDSRRGLSSHYSKVHGVDELEWQEAGGALKCTLCDATFRNRAKLTTHMKDIHSGGPELKCDKCGRNNFKSSRGLEMHKKACQG